MKFNSVKEYFYRLNSSGYQHMMLPLIVFILYFGQNAFMLLPPFLSNEVWISVIFITAAGFTFLCLTSVQIIYHQKYKRISRMVGLGIKLEAYGDGALRKMKWMTALAIALAASLFLTGDLRLAILFGVTVFWFFIQWPSPKTVARQLRLKGDEQKMVITRGDAFRI